MHNISVLFNCIFFETPPPISFLQCRFLSNSISFSKNNNTALLTNLFILKYTWYLDSLKQIWSYNFVFIICFP